MALGCKENIRLRESYEHYLINHRKIKLSKIGPQKTLLKT
jgi:hypothetical protein